MKVDFDSILYIVITLVIIVISALGSRRKKRLQKTQAPAPPGTDSVEPVEKKTSFTDLIKEASQAVSPDTYEASKTDPQQKIANPLERLEQFLTGQEARYASSEGESLETIVDEEEQILEEIQADSEEEQYEDIKHEPDTNVIIKADSEKIPLDLFTDVDEIKKAVIYSEILNRKYD
jgi:hypothetical protein